MRFISRDELEIMAWEIKSPEEKERVIEKFWEALLQISAKEK